MRALFPTTIVPRFPPPVRNAVAPHDRRALEPYRLHYSQYSCALPDIYDATATRQVASLGGHYFHTGRADHRSIDRASSSAAAGPSRDADCLVIAVVPPLSLVRCLFVQIA